jgi:DNA-binding response OmpR family regulator
MAERKKVLVIDDSAGVRKAVAEHLLEHGYDVKVAEDGVRGLQAVLSEKPDAVILDVMMPGWDGFKLCRMIRARGLTCPILMLTGRSDIDDKKEGFSSGADDYLAKPFDPVEVELRIEALLRRAASGPSTAVEKSVLKAGDVTIDLKSYTVKLRDKEVSLTPIEFQILRLLAEKPGTVYTRDEILNAIWETSYEGYKRNIDPHINRIRAKLEKNPKKPVYVQTVWGIGYKFNEQLPTGDQDVV